MVWTIVNNASGTPWTDVPQPQSGGTTIIRAGEAIGLLLALTYAEDQIIPDDTWTILQKASGTLWTEVPVNN